MHAMPLQRGIGYLRKLPNKAQHATAEGFSMADDVMCSGFFRAAEGADLSCLDKFQSGGLIQFVLGNILESFYNFFAAVLNPGLWLNLSLIHI